MRLGLSRVVALRTKKVRKSHACKRVLARVLIPGNHQVPYYSGHGGFATINLAGAETDCERIRSLGERNLSPRDDKYLADIVV